MVLTKDFVKARDRAYAKLMLAGFYKLDMEALFENEEITTIFVRLTATYFAYSGEMKDVLLDIRSFRERHPEKIHYSPF